MSLETGLIISRPYYIKSSDCGYCHGKKQFPQALESQRTGAEKSGESSSITIGVSVEQMTCEQYDEFINQGYRRSGTFLYKPDLLRNCCRLYTIRTDLNNLKILKMHRQTVNRFIRAISDGDDERDQKNSKFDLKSLIEAEQKSTKFKTVFGPSNFTKEKYELYKKYQIRVHNDDPEDLNEQSFDRFLCDTPFHQEEIEGTKAQWGLLNGWVENWPKIGQSPQLQENKRIGPTHECYYLDDKLIAISVLDFLPTGISSIYFIWDPDYANLSLGTLSGLREIQMCHELNLGYYYLGYYIDDCDKMKYKLKFGGEILDLANEVYFPIPQVSDYMKDGKLFVCGTSKDTPDTLHREFALQNTGHPKSLATSRFKNESLIRDISELVYGFDSNTHHEAETAYKLLQHKLKLSDLTPDDLPLVVPGVTPVWQILEMTENGTIHEKLKVTVFSMSHGSFGSTRLKDLTPIGRKMIIQFIRLFGIAKIENSIILI
ncbi:hypothetical protein HYPBUDRAFT_157838 [Hyphopichia burtonii NRRL Y-1933]|uniref:arginyltransferase n=1 Tax=Hyphopichia burtonii NRRL Y-1933 TaxID=984485 RepID=A0A1E4RHM6_9ASCO|nr:hypothetical protein HYPBUDRAFT_157838 [Hyphopichia burtonii NRRL Y-1933]ODV66716.1 hypothetical protein HYPBUDRAFT_157838 [Hyphopichia burtonii NRRL Y-1933]